MEHLQETPQRASAEQSPLTYEPCLDPYEKFARVFIEQQKHDRSQELPAIS